MTCAEIYLSRAWVLGNIPLYMMKISQFPLFFLEPPRCLGGKCPALSLKKCPSFEILLCGGERGEIY
jgi:hypothetical protein